MSIVVKGFWRYQRLFLALFSGAAHRPIRQVCWGRPCTSSLPVPAGDKWFCGLRKKKNKKKTQACACTGVRSMLPAAHPHPSHPPLQRQTDSVNRETFLMSPPAHLHIYEDRRWVEGSGMGGKEHKGANYNVVSTQQRLFSVPHLPSPPSWGKSFALPVRDLGVSSVCLPSIFMRQSTGRGDCLLWWCADQRTARQ